MTDELLAVEVLDRGPDLVVGVSGELDFGTTAGFLETVQPLAGAGRSLVLDLAEPVFCDSSGLGALVRLHKLTHDAAGKLFLARLRPQLEATITLTMLHRLFVIRDDVPDAGAVYA